MKTQKEVEGMMAELDRKIADITAKMNDAKSELQFQVARESRIQYMAQYNILLEVLK